MKHFVLSRCFSCFSLVWGMTFALPNVQLFAGQDEVIAADTLTTADHPGLEGKSLDGVPATQGGTWVVPTVYPPYTGAPWNFGPQTILAPSGDGVGADVSQKGPITANLPISPPGFPVTVQAQVKVGTSDWVALGFQQSAKGLVFTPGSLMFVTLGRDGQWELWKDQGQLQSLGKGAIQNFDPNAFTTLALQYDPSTTKAAVSVNGNDLAGPLSTSFPAMTDIESAGFYVYGARETARIRNFQVSLAHP